MENVRALRAVELRRGLTEDTLDDPQDAGRYRRDDEAQAVDVRDNTALHVPPPHAELPARMRLLAGGAHLDQPHPAATGPTLPPGVFLPPPGLRVRRAG